jgi:hypothetical protein
MRMIDLQAIMGASTALVLRDITDEELAGLNLTIALGNDPRKLECWPRVSPLFTQNNGTEMHSETLSAFQRVVERRLMAK